MLAFPEHEKPEEKKIFNSSQPIKSLYAQIRKMPELTTQARAVDQVLIQHQQELKKTASTVVDQFNEQKKLILQRFDNWIMPIAKEVLDNLLSDVKQLKFNLDDKLESLDQTTPEEWKDQAKHWVQFYMQWHDRNGLIEKILEVVAERTRHLIDKDIQVIQDYQTQSLEQLPKESAAFKNIEERLSKATEEPLKRLISLRNRPQEHTSLQQASEWIARLQERREIYFDQLLMKIDHVMKDVVHIDDKRDLASFLEVEGEILFMEREFHHINEDLSHLSLGEESEKQFILARLEGLLDHVDELEKHRSLPQVLQQRVEGLKTKISVGLSILL